MRPSSGFSDPVQEVDSLEDGDSEGFTPRENQRELGRHLSYPRPYHACKYVVICASDVVCDSGLRICEHPKRWLREEIILHPHLIFAPSIET